MAPEDNLEVKYRLAATRFAESLRLGQLQGVGHQAVAELLDLLLVDLNVLVGARGQLDITLRDEALYANDILLSCPPGHHRDIVPLVECFGRLKLDTLSLRKRLSRRDLEDLLTALVVGVHVEGAHHRLRTVLGERGAIITADEAEAVRSATMPDRSGRIRGLYHSFISFTMELHDRIAEGKEIELQKLKRFLLFAVEMLEHEDSLLLGTALLRHRYEYVFYHPANVSIFSMALGHRLGLGRHELLDLGVAGFFCDAGRYLVPAEVLLEKGGCDGPGQTFGDRHAALGFKTLFPIRDFDDQLLRAAIVSFEHSLQCIAPGYPKASPVSGQDFYTRIVAVTGRYDALTAAGQLGGQHTPEAALAALLEKAGSELDPALVKSFATMMGAYPVGSLVVLDSGVLAIVAKPHAVLLKRPEVLVISDAAGGPVEPAVVDLAKRDADGRYAVSISASLDPSGCRLPYDSYLV